MHRFFVFAVLATVCFSSIKAEDFSIAGLRARALKGLSEGDNRVAIENADAIIRQSPESARAMRYAADIYLRAGEVKYAVRLFDKYLKKEEKDLPELWQRGIALYFAGDFKRGAAQFEVHRSVNPNDVENAAWHYLCVAKASSVKKANEGVLPAPGDPRPPMKEVLEMLKSGDQSLVIKRMEAIPKDTQERMIADFYGNFYLGLYADANGKAADAKKYMNKAASDAPHNYMGDVARVYAKYLSGKL